MRYIVTSSDHKTFDILMLTYTLFTYYKLT